MTQKKTPTNPHEFWNIFVGGKHYLGCSKCYVIATEENKNENCKKELKNVEIKRKT